VKEAVFGLLERGTEGRPGPFHEDVSEGAGHTLGAEGSGGSGGRHARSIRNLPGSSHEPASGVPIDGSRGLPAGR